MKPQDLKPPFTAKTKKILIQDRVWYIPYLEVPSPFVFPGWADPSLFGREAPLHIEYCSGNGDWVVAKAQQHPEVNWLAVELQFDRARKIWSKVKNRGVENLVILCGEGLHSTRSYFPDGCAQSVFVNFPDPWPKRRHAKHRVVSAPFLAEMRRILVPDGSLMVVTDDSDFSSGVTELLQCDAHFTSNYPAPYYTHDYPDYGTSFFEALWRNQGKSIYYHLYQLVPL